MKKQIGVAIIGAGMIGGIHQRASRLADGALVGVLDANPEHCARTAERWGTQAYASVEAIMNDPAVEVVHVCTPNALHYGLAKAALEETEKFFRWNTEAAMMRNDYEREQRQEAQRKAAEQKRLAQEREQQERQRQEEQQRREAELARQKEAQELERQRERAQSLERRPRGMGMGR